MTKMAGDAERASITYDLTIIVDGVEFPCNKDELMTASEYFKAMFSSNMRESKKNTIEIHEIDSHDMEQLLQISRTTSSAINYKGLTQLRSLTRAATMLCFDKVIKRCEAELVKVLKKSSCVELMVFADDCGLTELYNEARGLALYYFEEVYKLPSFLTLDFQRLSNYLQDDYLHTTDEIHILQSILIWAEKEPSRLCYLQELLCCVHWRDITQQALAQLTLPDSVQQSDSWVKVLQEHKDGPLQTEKSILPEKCWKTRAVPATPLLQATLLPKTLNSNEISDAEHKLITFENGMAHVLTTLPKEAPYLLGSAVATKGCDLYISGGQHNTYTTGAWNKNIWGYNTIKKAWKILACVPGSGYMRHHAMVAWKSYLYFIGGFGQYRVISNKAYRYHLSTKSYETLPELGAPIFAACACAHDNRLFVMKSHVECWSEGDKAWTRLTCNGLPYGGIVTQCFTLDDAIYMNVMNLCTDATETEKMQLLKMDCKTSTVTDVVLCSEKFDDLRKEMDNSLIQVINGALYILLYKERDFVVPQLQMFIYEPGNDALPVTLTDIIINLSADITLSVSKLRFLSICFMKKFR